MRVLIITDGRRVCLIVAGILVWSLMAMLGGFAASLRPPFAAVGLLGAVTALGSRPPTSRHAKG